MSDKTYEKLKRIRAAETIDLPPCDRLVTHITKSNGEQVEFALRHYQKQMVMHLLMRKRFVVGDDTGLGKCLTKNSLVTTTYGLTKIGDMHDWSGMEPDTFAPVDQDWHVLVNEEKLPVKNFYYGGVKPTIKMRTRYNFEVEGSRVHPLLVWRDCKHQWVEMRDLREGDYICVERREMDFPLEEPTLDTDIALSPWAKSHKLPTKVTGDFARWIGYVVGEGWFNNDYTLSISQCPERNHEIHEDIRHLTSTLFGYDLSDVKDKLVSSVQIIDFLKQNGLNKGLAADKQVPNFILCSTRESNVEFLRGLFEGEGHVLPCGGIEFSTASEELGRVVQIMLTRFGIVSNRSEKVVKNYEHNTYWRLTIFGQDARAFRDKIGFVSSRKRDALESALDRSMNPNHDVIPCCKSLIEPLRARLKAVTSRSGGNGNRKGSGLKQFGCSFVNTLNNIRNRGRNPSYAFLEHYLDVCAQHGLTGTSAWQNLNALQESCYFYDPVVSLTEGEAEVFDIEVDDPRHWFVANGVVSHNTAECISSQCYMWTREPNLIPIVITTTSAMRQWAGEFHKFTNGVDTVVVDGGPDKRKKIYDEFFEEWSPENPSVLILNYPRMRIDYRTLKKHLDGRQYALWMDECFDYHTPVLLADGTTELIGKIVCQKLDVEVMSYNFETGKTEPRRVVNWWRNKVTKKHKMLKITFAHGNSVRCTSTHKIYRPDGTKVRASKLKPGDQVLHFNSKPPTTEQQQIIYGGLLGDASLSNPQRACPSVAFRQGIAQSDYMEWKQKVLGTLGTSSLREEPSGYEGGSSTLCFNTHANAHITATIKTAGFYKNRKQITTAWLDKIEPLGLAVWYADDGSLSVRERKKGRRVYQIELSTHGFTREENELLAGWLRWKWGVDAQVKTRKGRTGDFYVIYLPDEAARAFLDLLPGALPGVEYKFPDHDPYVSPDMPSLDATVIDHVVSVEAWEPARPEKYVYDLEVEGNHNYFAGGTLVSNCAAVKSPSSATHTAAKRLAEHAWRAYGITATLIKNNLLEGFGIYSVVVPGLFSSEKGFMRNFCVTKMQPIGRGRKVPVIVGHSRDHVQLFRERIDPYYLGRAKHTVAKELPTLTTKEVVVPMSRSQWKHYQDAVEGLLTVNEAHEMVAEASLIDPDADDAAVETSHLTQLIYCQEIVNDLYLIGNEGISHKVEMLMDMLEGELAGEKVIVFTRFRKMVDRLQELLADKGYELGIAQDHTGEWQPRTECKQGLVRVTGAESSEEREAGRQAFVGTEGTNLIFLTMAGAEALNLQEARVMVFFDLPWSAGDYLQLVGRMIRIGSPHQSVYAIHMISEGPFGEATIDRHVAKTLDRKMGYIEGALGQRLLGNQEGQEEDFIFGESSPTRALYDAMLQSVRESQDST